MSKLEKVLLSTIDYSFHYFKLWKAYVLSELLVCTNADISPKLNSVAVTVTSLVIPARLFFF